MKMVSGIVFALFLSVLLLPEKVDSACPGRPRTWAPPQQAAPAAAGLSVVSLNLAREKDWHTILRDLDRVPTLHAADVFLFQEAAHSDGEALGVAGQLARALGLSVVFTPAETGVYDRGLAILSRYPLRDVLVTPLKQCNLRFHKRSRFSLTAIVDAPVGPVRVSNVHLDTRINAQERLEQLRPVVDAAASSATAAIIGGDLNTNNFYWLANVLPVPLVASQTGAVRDFMRSRGFTAPHQPEGATFDHLGMHLDWVYQKRLEATSASVHPLPFSDHHALLVGFR